MGFMDLFSGKPKKEESGVSLSELIAEFIINDLTNRKQWVGLKEMFVIDDECEINISNEFVALNIFAWDLSLHQQLDGQMRDEVMTLVSDKYGTIFKDEKAEDFVDERMGIFGFSLQEGQAAGKSVSESTGKAFAGIVGSGNVNPETWVSSGKVFLALLTENKKYFDEIKSAIK